MTGGVLSIRTVRRLAASSFPELSIAEYVSVVIPSPEIVTTPLLPLKAPDPLCAPRRENRISFTPAPSWLSDAERVTTTLVLFQPLAFALGAALAMVVGGTLSETLIGRPESVPCSSGERRKAWPTPDSGQP